MNEISEITQTELEDNIIRAIDELGSVCMHPERLPAMVALAHNVRSKFIEYVDNARLLKSKATENGQTAVL
jgi:hypothetical protein